MTSDALKATQQEYYEQGYAAGYTKGKGEKPAGCLKDPTYVEVQWLLRKANECTKCGYGSPLICQYASGCLMTAATEYGIKSHLVVLSDLSKPSHHAIVAFMVNGVPVFVEPQLMEVVKPVEGEYYQYTHDKFFIEEMLVFP
jgi:hypothetical protein